MIIDDMDNYIHKDDIQDYIDKNVMDNYIRKDDVKRAYELKSDVYRYYTHNSTVKGMCIGFGIALVVLFIITWGVGTERDQYKEQLCEYEPYVCEGW